MTPTTHSHTDNATLPYTHPQQRTKTPNTLLAGASTFHQPPTTIHPTSPSPSHSLYLTHNQPNKQTNKHTTRSHSHHFYTGTDTSNATSSYGTSGKVAEYTLPGLPNTPQTRHGGNLPVAFGLSLWPSVTLSPSLALSCSLALSSSLSLSLSLGLSRSLCIFLCGPRG